VHQSPRGHSNVSEPIALHQLDQGFTPRGDESDLPIETAAEMFNHLLDL
jgi:hypothetical protein